MTQILKILAQGVPTVREVLHPYTERTIDQVTEVLPEEGNEEKKDDPKSVLLKLPQYSAVVSEVRSKLQEQEGEAYITEQVDRFPEFTTYEESIQDALKNVTDILSRVHGRRTGMFSWILLFVLRYCGFGGDDFTRVQEILKDPNFIRQFARYHSFLRNDDEAGAKQYLQENFSKDEKTQSLVKIVSKVMNTCDKLPKRFVGIFPIAFTVQNLLVPFLARFFKTGPLGRLFDFMRLVNPWISEFAAEPIGIFKAEIDNVRKALPQEDVVPPLNNEAPVASESNGKNQDIVDSIQITGLDEQEYRLQKIVQEIFNASERLFGRKTTLSSWLFILLLKFSKDKHDSFQEFKEKYVANSGFIKELCNHFKDLRKIRLTGRHLQKAENKLLSERFQEVEERFVAKVVSLVISIANVMPKGFIEKAPKYFGFPYSFQYLLMPIVTKLIKEDSFLGKLLGVIRDVNPILNDLIFDPMATFQEEIKAIKMQSETNIYDLLPKIEVSKPKAFDILVDHTKSLFNMVRSYSAQIYEKFAQSTELSTP